MKPRGISASAFMASLSTAGRISGAESQKEVAAIPSRAEESATAPDQEKSMSETKWTPGPWSADWDDNGQWYIEPLGVTGTALRGDSGDCLERRNARLISAAPELYEALNDIMKCVDAGVLVRDTSRDIETGWALHQLPLVLSLKAAVAALSKARGEA